MPLLESPIEGLEDPKLRVGIEDVPILGNEHRLICPPVPPRPPNQLRTLIEQ